MIDFLTSPSFPFWAALAVFGLIVFAALWKNLHWPARDVTPDAQVEEQKKRWEWLKALFPKSRGAWTAIGIVLAGAVLWFFWSSAPATPGWSLKAPTLGQAWQFVKGYWLWIFVGIAVAYMLSYLIKKEREPAAKAARGILVMMVPMLFVVLPLVDFFWGEKSPSAQVQQRQAVVRESDDCAKKEPCTPFLEANGLTEKVRMKGGRSLCFDDSFFTNLSRLGYKTSYQGTAEDPGCTTVSCKMDTFWFEPEAGIRVPKYWYVPEGSPRC